MGKLSPSYRFPFDEDRIKSKEKQELADYLKDLVKSLRNMWDELYRAINTVLSLPNTIAKVLTDHDKAAHDALGIDHGSLDGLGDDDHAQYHNDARGDARYYTETELDGGQLDTRYYTEAEVNTLLAAKGFIDRGDPAAYDWTQATLTADSNWYDLDCSGIVPAGAKAIVFGGYMTDNTANTALAFRKNGNVNVINYTAARTQVAAVPQDINCIVACDADRVVEYSINQACDTIRLTIRGWFM